jgi:hypothetical protein
VCAGLSYFAAKFRSNTLGDRYGGNSSWLRDCYFCTSPRENGTFGKHELWHLGCFTASSFTNDNNCFMQPNSINNIRTRCLDWEHISALRSS